MKASTRHNLVQAAVVAGSTIMQKNATASPMQQQAIARAMPDAQTQSLSKRASLARLISTGDMVSDED